MTAFPRPRAGGPATASARAERSSSTIARPTNDPTTNAGPFTRARGVTRIRITAMIETALNATRLRAQASARSPHPCVSPSRLLLLQHPRSCQRPDHPDAQRDHEDRPERVVRDEEE